MRTIEKFVWRTIISPKDKKLDEEMYLTVNEMPIFVKLYRISLEANHLYVKQSSMASYYLATRLDKWNRKLLIIFPGRNFNFIQLDKMLYTKKFYETNKLDDFDIATIIYPKTVHNLDEFTHACTLAIEQLVTKHAYSSEDVSIMGWCLGGYFATETMRKFAETNQSLGMFENFVNTKSFVSINHFLHHILPKYLRFVLKFGIVKKNANLWNNDASHSMLSFDCYFKNIFVIFANKDKIVKDMGHFHRHLNDRLKEKVFVHEDAQISNHLINWSLVADLLNFQ